ncbi:hypothetical protein BOTBODRAFT_35909 [Botryobasidium botryosum FD-172 SS1]|uniref:Uncharacterized protein n=1 Tax=Botryobasidium botryosum (strain FD-172 SS1) TaxID=930990 RepID=A0A067MFZ1_BOTB1|nr:hypothetical protein BOTBODRAFT_35909 [Botryobasidium botryosum FD-172 SS1]
MEARRKEKALYNTSTRSLSSSATFPVQRPSRASLPPSPQNSGCAFLGDRTNAPIPSPLTMKVIQKRTASPTTSPSVRSTICVAAEKNVAGICIIIQSPTLASVKDILVGDLPGDIALLAAPKTPLHWAQLRAKGAQTARVCAKAHLAALRKEPDVEERKRRVIARVKAERAARQNLPFPVRRESPTERHERMQKALLAELLPAYKLTIATRASPPTPPTSTFTPAESVPERKKSLRGVAGAFDRLLKGVKHDLGRLGSALKNLA